MVKILKGALDFWIDKCKKNWRALVIAILTGYCVVLTYVVYSAQGYPESINWHEILVACFEIGITLGISAFILVFTVKDFLHLVGKEQKVGE